MSGSQGPTSGFDTGTEPRMLFVHDSRKAVWSCLWESAVLFALLEFALEKAFSNKLVFRKRRML